MKEAATTSRFLHTQDLPRRLASPRFARLLSPNFARLLSPPIDQTPTYLALGFTRRICKSKPDLQICWQIKPDCLLSAGVKPDFYENSNVK